MFGAAKRQKPNWREAAMVLGGGLRELGGSQGAMNNALNYVDSNRQQMAQAAQQAQQQQQLQAAIAKMNLSPQLAAAAQLNPQAVSAALAKQQLGHHTVGQGNSLVTYGANGPQMTQAAQNFQNGSQIAQVGPQGVSVTDMGPNAANRVTMRGQDMTAQTAQMKDATTRRGQDVTSRGDQMGYDADMAKIAFDRDKFQHGVANPTSDLGKNPLYMTDAQGNVVIGQLGNGQIVPAQTPDGMSVMSPYERSFEQSRGRQTGKMQGEASGSLPAATLRAEEALQTTTELLNHPGLVRGTGMSAPLAEIPGTSARGFKALHDQVQSQAFLQGFEMLKGAGVITEFEGQRAEKALARMDRSQSAEDYKAAIRDFQDVIQRGLATAQERAGQSGPIGGLSADEQRELEELERLYGGN